MTLYIDPPSGWRYGFPKPAPTNLREMTTEQLHGWLCINGYPRKMIDMWDKGIPVRYFEFDDSKPFVGDNDHGD